MKVQYCIIDKFNDTNFIMENPSYIPGLNDTIILDSKVHDIVKRIFDPKYNILTIYLKETIWQQ